jgi:hypothetical protein
MISERAIKERAMQIDPCAFKSYSGSSRRDAQQEALSRARRELEWSSPEQRRYTLNEIDRMRTAIRRTQPFNNPMVRSTGTPSVEDQVRTAMIGGVDPKELEEKADLFWESIRQRRAMRLAERAEREANDACIRVNCRAISVTAHAEAIVADVPVNSFWKRLIISRIEALFSRLGMGSGG